MRRVKAKLVYFITWLLLTTVVAGRVVGSSSEVQSSARDNQAVDEQLVNKLYPRVIRELNKKASEYKGEINELTEQKRQIDEQIKEKERRLSALQSDAAQIRTEINEADNKGQEIEAALKGNKSLTAEERRRLENQLKGLRERRNAGQRLIDQNDEQLALLGDIEELRRYQLPSHGQPWNMNTADVSTIPALTQEFEHLLGRVEVASEDTRQQYEAWEADKSEANLYALKAHLVSLAATAAVTCKVDIKSEDASGNETTGATIKYLTGRQRRYGEKPKTLGRTARLGQTMASDNYYMWTERQGRATSSPDELIAVGADEEVIILVEN